MGVASPGRATQGSRMTPNEERVLVAVEGDGNQAAVAYEGQTVRLEVFSARGMGRASVEISPEAWPASLTLRLHLGGLESFRFRFDPHTVSCVGFQWRGAHRSSKRWTRGRRARTRGTRARQSLLDGRDAHPPPR